VKQNPAGAVWEAVSSAEAALLQNTLMRMPDKVCAVALATLPKEKRFVVYSRIAGPKAARIEEEIGLEARRRTSALMRARIIRSFLSYFGRVRRVPGRIWIRPIKPPHKTREDRS
jgi:hypothetical protein